MIFILLLFLISCNSSLYSMENDFQKNSSHDLLRGYCSLVAVRLTYYGYQQQYPSEENHTLYLQKALGYKIPPNELLFQVMVTSDNCYDWHKNKYPPFSPFPKYLPYTLIKDLKEYDLLELELFNKPYILLANQLLSEHAQKDFERFEQMRDQLLVVSKKRGPNYFFADEDLLLSAGILAQDPHSTEIIHGPAGFDFKQIKLSKKENALIN